MKITSKFGGRPVLFLRNITCPFFALMIITCFSNCQRNSINNHLILEKGWKFNSGDNIDYAKDDYNDANWHDIKINTSWQQQGFDFVGFAWYRKKFYLPSFRDKMADSDSLRIFLGEIQNSHQVFLNGFIIAENGKIVPESHVIDSAFSRFPYPKITVTYLLAINDSRIKWNKENVISIRIFNGRTNGGLVKGIPSLRLLGFEDSIKFNHSFYLPDSTGYQDTTLVMTNLSRNVTKGILKIRGINLATEKIIYSNNVPMEIISGNFARIPVSLPITTDQIQIFLTFEDHLRNKIITDSLNVPFVLSKGN